MSKKVGLPLCPCTSEGHQSVSIVTLDRGWCCFDSDFRCDKCGNVLLRVRSSYNSSGELEEDNITVSTDQNGIKDDNGKARFDLIPAHAIEALAELYATGAKKYDDRNWEKGLSWGRVFAALMRHAWAWWRGEKKDPEDGQHHMTSVAWCAFALYEYDRRRNGTDDRPKDFNVGGPVERKYD